MTGIGPSVSASSDGRLDIKKTRLQRISSQPAAWALLAVLGMVLFTWPFATDELSWSAREGYFFLMISWAVLIILLALFGTIWPKMDDGTSGPTEG